MRIHPTALIDPQAEIAESAEIGPFVVIESGVKIGADCVIQAHAQVIGSVEIGDRCKIGHNAVIGGVPQDLSFDESTQSGVRIGTGNVFREHVTVHRSSRENGVTEIGCDNMLMVGCHVGHDSVIGDRNILANQCLLGGHVHLGDGAFLGGGAAFHQFVRVGDLCMVKGLAAISQDVPPYVLASDSNRVRGLNSVGMRRAGLSAVTRQSVKEAFRQIFLEGLNLKQALDAAADRMWEPEAMGFIDFFRVKTSRGVCHP